MFKKQTAFLSLVGLRWDFFNFIFFSLNQSEAFPDITGAARVCACRKKNQEPDTSSCKAALAGGGFSMLTTSQELPRSPSIRFPCRKPILFTLLRYFFIYRHLQLWSGKKSDRQNQTAKTSSRFCCCQTRFEPCRACRPQNCSKCKAKHMPWT